MSTQLPHLIYLLNYPQKQELLSGGRRGCYKKCYWVCPKADGSDRGGRDDENRSDEE